MTDVNSHLAVLPFLHILLQRRHDQLLHELPPFLPSLFRQRINRELLQQSGEQELRRNGGWPLRCSSRSAGRTAADLLGGCGGRRVQEQGRSGRERGARLSESCLALRLATRPFSRLLSDLLVDLLPFQLQLHLELLELRRRVAAVRVASRATHSGELRKEFRYRVD